MAQYVYDGSISFQGGQHDGILPDRIQEDQFATGINVSTKTGGLSPRPGYIEVELSLVEDPIINSVRASQVLKQGKFQALAPFASDNGRFIIVVISGIIFKIDPSTGVTEILDLEDGDYLNQYKRRIYWSKAGKFLVLFDWPSPPVIIDGSGARRSDIFRTHPTLGTPQPEVPTAVLGAFVQNRLWIGNEGGEFTAGDPVSVDNPDAPVTFEEVLVPGAAYFNQVFSVGSSSINSEITAMGALQQADTSTGYGPLYVSTREAIYTYAANTARANWTNSQFGAVSVFNSGIAGGRAVSNVNSDLIFVDSEGQIRALSTARNAQQQWGNSPISREVRELIKTKNSQLLTYSFVTYNDNRVLISARPTYARAVDTYGKTTLDIAHEGLVVMELNNISGLRQGAIPAWAGAWVDIKPMDAAAINGETYIFSKDFLTRNRLYLLKEDYGFDQYAGKKKPIVSRVYTRTYNFNAPFQDKELIEIDYTLSKVAGDPFEFTAEYSASHDNNWALWRKWEHKAVNYTCKADDCEIKNLLPHSFKNVNLGDSEEKPCDQITDDLNDTLRRVALRLTMKGSSWLLEQVRIKADLDPETGNGDLKCDDLVGKEVVKSCDEVDEWNIGRQDDNI